MDGFLPRSLISFYHSTNGETWSQVGSDHTSGLVIDLIKNDSFFEVGGWGDGQSPGESYLDGYIKKTNSSKSKLTGDFLFKKKDKKEAPESEERPDVVNKEAIA